jgi:hypothetical protein
MRKSGSDSRIVILDPSVEPNFLSAFGQKIVILLENMLFLALTPKLQLLEIPRQVSAAVQFF